MKKIVILMAVLSLVSYTCYAQRIKIHQEAKSTDYILSNVDSITHDGNQSVNIFYNNKLSTYYINTVDSISINTSTYYKIPADYLNGWDDGISCDSIYYIVYKETGDGLYYYLNNRSGDNTDGLLIVLNQNGSIIGIVHQGIFYSILEDDTKITILRLNEDGINEETIDISGKAKTGTRGTPQSPWEYLLGKIPVLGEILNANSINNDVINRQWAAFLTDVGDFLLNIGINLMGIEGHLLAAPFEMIRMEALQHAKSNANIIYGDCTVEITDICKGSDGQIEIYVTVKNANSMRQYIKRNYYPESLENTRNNVYCGVVGKSEGLPTTQNFTNRYKSQEEQIPTDGSVSTLYLLFLLPDVPAGQTYSFRPYLKSTRIKNIWGDVDQVYIKYGEVVEYSGSVGTIVELNTTSALCSTDTGTNVFVSFDNWITARLYSNEGNEWGVFVDNGTGSYDEKYVTDDISKVSGFINVPHNVYKNQFDEIDYSNFVATKLFKLGVYLHLNNPTGNYDYLYWLYSVPQEFKLVYDKTPNVKTLESISTDKTSAVIKCSYEGCCFWDIPCGLEYVSNDVCQNLIVFPDHDGEHEIHLSELTPNTKYQYRAYYEINGEKKYGVYNTFTTGSDNLCPDNNHPHWIDLGLPSGTQWRCCNEGASTPEAYGGYYTFGQVSSAPTLEQIEELLYNCKYEYTTQNGVTGGKFTGPNGGTIFLPAAGLRWGGEFYYVGSDGRYWSSTPGVESGAYQLYFSFRWDYAVWGLYDPISEQSVRPVR